MIFIRFFNGAIGLNDVDILINGELIVKGLKRGAFSEFRQGLAGAYFVEIRPAGISDTVIYTELFNVLEDTAYTIAIAGNAAHIALAMLPLSIKEDVKLPNIRFANAMGFDSIIDIIMHGHGVATGLMFKDISENIGIDPGSHDVSVYDENGQKLIENSVTIKPGINYLAIVAGQEGNAKNPPQIYLEENMPLL